MGALWADCQARSNVEPLGRSCGGVAGPSPSSTTDDLFYLVDTRGGILWQVYKGVPPRLVYERSAY